MNKKITLFDGEKELIFKVEDRTFQSVLNHISKYCEAETEEEKEVKI